MMRFHRQILASGLLVACTLTVTAAAEEDRGLEQRLLDALLNKEKPAAAEPTEVARRIVKQMEQSAGRLDDRNCDAETLKLQKQLVSDLEQLTKQLRQTAPDLPSRQQQPAGKQLEPTDSEPQNGSTQPSQGEGGGRTNQPADRSTERVDPNSAEQAKQQHRRSLVKDIWGHLPPAVRQKMLNAYDEQTLPRYSDLIRRYYEALAEPESPNR